MTLEIQGVMVFNATFNNISVILWRSVQLVEENGSTHRKPPPDASHSQTWSHSVVSSTSRHDRDTNSQLLVVIGTDCIGSCKFNYHTITKAPVNPSPDIKMWRG